VRASADAGHLAIPFMNVLYVQHSRELYSPECNIFLAVPLWGCANVVAQILGMSNGPDLQPFPKSSLEIGATRRSRRRGRQWCSARGSSHWTDAKARAVDNHHGRRRLPQWLEPTPRWRHDKELLTRRPRHSEAMKDITKIGINGIDITNRPSA
jgi:hypothetical protein